MGNQRRAAHRHGPRRDVVIAYCRPDSVDGFFHDACWNLALYDRDHGNRIHGTIGYESGPRLGAARCATVRAFLLTDAQWLCWFDTDMVPGDDFLDRIMEHAHADDRPIVGGLCFAGGRTKLAPTIYVIGKDDGGPLASETILSYPVDQLIEVGGTGSACVVIHRSVFEKIEVMMPEGHPLPWYQDVVIDNKDWGEDLVFCLRARAAGASIWIHTGIQVGHRKKWTMDERAFISYAAKLDAMAGGPKAYTADTLPPIELAPDIIPDGLLA
jgi:GT2 family glycosyltransferase